MTDQPTSGKRTDGRTAPTSGSGPVSADATTQPASAEQTQPPASAQGSNYGSSSGTLSGTIGSSAGQTSSGSKGPGVTAGTSYTLWSKVLMGFAVCFLIGVLVRLIQLRAKRLRGQEDLGLVKTSYSGGGYSTGTRCCFLSTTVAILLGGLALLFIMFRARQAKEQQHKDNVAWNCVAAIVLICGIFLLLEFSRLTHEDASQWECCDHTKRGFTLWVYFIVAAAALAAAKVTSKLMRPARQVMIRRRKSRPSYFT